MSDLQSTALDRIKRELDQRGVRYEEADDGLAVEPVDDDGFTVWIRQDADSWVVGFDPWHEHFNTDEEAYHLFRLGLTGECRLRVALRGNNEYRWTIETINPDTGKWIAGSTTGLMLFPFWRRRSETIRQNRWNVVGQEG